MHTAPDDRKLQISDEHCKLWTEVCHVENFDRQLQFCSVGDY